ncbi:MAG: FtsX-like permease family protein [Polyangiaceae bacterium]
MRDFLSARIKKILGDMRSAWGRLLLMVLAITVSLVALGAVFGARDLLVDAMDRNYLGTHPADATLELPNGADADAQAAALATGLVSAVEAREVVAARVRVGEEIRPLLLFVVDDFTKLRLNTFRPVAGEWPPPRGTVLVERSALGMADAAVGDDLAVIVPNGGEHTATISGLVHDPGLAPAWQERSVYAYTTRETMADMGEDATLHELRVAFVEPPANVRDAELAAQRLGRALESQGVEVHELRVPPPRQHPHQRQFVTVVTLMLCFAALSLVLASVVVATTLSAILARQIREIGVMKALGATRRSLTAMYVVMVAGLGALAFLLAIPLSWLGARAFAISVSEMLNLELGPVALPITTYLVEALAGVLVPVLFTLGPIRRATGMSVREALADYGVVLERRSLRALPVALRSLLRRPLRLAMNLALLSIAGALFIAALSVRAAWTRNLEAMREARHYDVEVRLHRGATPAVREATASTTGVTNLEWWGYARAAFAKDGEIDTVRTYPDRGHGSLVMMAPPADTPLVTFPIKSGRWLREGDEDVVVLSHVAAAMSGARVGDDLPISVEGFTQIYKVVGVVEEIGSAGVVYVTDRVFERRYGALTMARLATRATDAPERAATIHALEDALARSGASVEVVMPFTELRSAIGDHLVVLVRALFALAIILAIVGVIGLGSAISIGVVERTREIGVMKTLGATKLRIAGMIVSEAALTAAFSLALGVLVTLPVTGGIESLVGKLGFMAPLPFVVSKPAIAVWAVVVLVASSLAALVPARRAARITVREAVASL